MSFCRKWPRVTRYKADRCGGRDVTFFSEAGRRWALGRCSSAGRSSPRPTAPPPSAPRLDPRAPRWRNAAAASAARPSVSRAALRPGHHARRAQYHISENHLTFPIFALWSRTQSVYEVSVWIMCKITVFIVIQCIEINMFSVYIRHRPWSPDASVSCLNGLSRCKFCFLYNSDTTLCANLMFIFIVSFIRLGLRKLKMDVI